MKRAILAIIATLTATIAGYAGIENFKIYDTGGIDPNYVIETYLNYSTTQCAYVSVTNGSDVDFLIEFNAGHHTSGVYVTNNSINTAVNLYHQNCIDYAYFTLDHLPPGDYTITVNDTASTTTNVYYY